MAVENSTKTTATKTRFNQVKRNFIAVSYPPLPLSSSPPLLFSFRLVNSNITKRYFLETKTIIHLLHIFRYKMRFFSEFKQIFYRYQPYYYYDYYYYYENTLVVLLQPLLTNQHWNSLVYLTLPFLFTSSSLPLPIPLLFWNPCF